MKGNSCNFTAAKKPMKSSTNILLPFFSFDVFFSSFFLSISLSFLLSFTLFSFHVFSFIYRAVILLLKPCITLFTPPSPFNLDTLLSNQLVRCLALLFLIFFLNLSKNLKSQIISRNDLKR